MYTTLQNTPLLIDVPLLARSTGWTMANNKATHETCNAGYLTLNDLNLEVGVTYEFSVNIESISGGYLQAFLGDDASPQYTTTGYKFASSTVSAGDTFRFYSTGNCVISEFVARRASQPLDQKATNTIVFNEKLNKWSSFYSFQPDCGASLFTNLFSFKNGVAYIHVHNSFLRNNFYGDQYQSLFRFVDNKNSTIIKTYNGIALQSDNLMVTTEDGIETSLGNVSELSDVDFIKSKLTQGTTSINVTSVEGIYSAGFLFDKNSSGGLINGDVLKGNFITVELITSDGSTALNLYSVAVNASVSRIGVR